MSDLNLEPIAQRLHDARSKEPWKSDIQIRYCKPLATDHGRGLHSLSSGTCRDDENRLVCASKTLTYEQAREQLIKEGKYCAGHENHNWAFLWGPDRYTPEFSSREYFYKPQADFIAHAREDVKCLITEVESLRTENEQLKAKFKDGLVHKLEQENEALKKARDKFKYQAEGQCDWCGENLEDATCHRCVNKNNAQYQAAIKGLVEAIEKHNSNGAGICGDALAAAKSPADALKREIAKAVGEVKSQAKGAVAGVIGAAQRWVRFNHPEDGECGVSDGNILRRAVEHHDFTTATQQTDSKTPEEQG